MSRYLDERKHNHLSTEYRHSYPTVDLRPFSPKLTLCLQLPNSLGIGKSLEMPPRHVDGVDASQDEIQIVNTPDGSTSDSVSSRDHDDTATPSVKKQKIVEDARVSELTEDEVSNVLEESEYSAPKFMSLVCIMQMVKLMDAVGILFPHTLPQGVQPITSKKEFLDQFSNAKMSAHIDCPNCKAFVSYRWYANDVKKLKTHLASTDQDSQKVYFCCHRRCPLIFIHSLQVVGCCSLGHWKRKPPGAKPGRGDAKSVRLPRYHLLFVGELPFLTFLLSLMNFAAVSSVLGQLKSHHARGSSA
jgi:hypothetical protein